MATYTKRGDRWRVQVTVHGTRKSKTLPTKSHAQAWARMMERDDADVQSGMIPSKTVNDLLDRYDREVSVHKGGARWEHIRILKLQRDPLAAVNTRELSAQDVADWRDRSLAAGLSGSSVNREWALLSAVFDRAIREWGWLKLNPMRMATRPKSNPERKRRPTQDEIDKLLEVMQFDGAYPVSVGQRLAFVMLFGIETAMRTGEMCAMRWQDVSDRVVEIPKTKNGDARTVPLSRYARELLGTFRKDDQEPDDLVFELKPSQVDANFRKMRKKAGIDDLHFHDFRREGTTRLAKKVDVMTLAKITGHRDVRILLKTYYAPKMDEVADLLD
jgi:integrase